MLNPSKFTFKCTSVSDECFSGICWVQDVLSVTGAVCISVNKH